MSCWACELASGARRQHKTRWYYLSPRFGLICDDLHPKGCDRRLLYVPRKHMPCGSEREADRKKAVSLLTDVVARCLPGYCIVAFDLSHHSYREHWHAQVCLEES